MEHEIIRHCHESNGHVAANKVGALLKQQYWIKDRNPKIQRVLDSCVNRKSGKQEGFLNSIQKYDIPLDTFHLDHLGPLPSTNKRYNHIFAIVDAFTKFIWLFPVKGTTCQETITKMQILQQTFGNPRRIITDKGTAFTANEFSNYCTTQNIEHHIITTGVPRGNGQVERLNRSIISILAKASVNEPEAWYKYVGDVQLCINGISNRSTGRTPFELMIGVKVKRKDDLNLKYIVEEEIINSFDDERQQLRENACSQINKIQKENSTQYNRKRKEATKYEIGDIVVIKRTQFGAGLKLKPKFLGPYKVVSVNRNDRYLVEKLGQTEGPIKTSTSADMMKRYIDNYSDSED